MLVNLFLQQTTPPDPFDNTVPLFESLVLSSADVAPGNDVTLTIVVNDPDPGDVVILSWTATGGSFDVTDAPSVVWTAPATEGLYSLTVAASDNTGATSTLTISIDVQIFYGSGSASVEIDINTWPEVQNLVPSPTRIDVGETTQLVLTATDPDGDPLTYAWSASCSGTFSDASIANPSFTLDADNAGVTCTLSAAVDDGRGGTNAASVAVATGPPLSASPGVGSGAGVGEIVITELMIDPAAVADSVGEWFEIFNPTADTLSLEGCEIGDDGSDLDIIPSGIDILPGEYLVFGNNADPASNGIGASPSYVYGANVVLQNGADELELRCNGVVVDRVFWISAPLGASYELGNIHLSASENDLVDQSGNWCVADVPSPGSVNFCL